MTQKTVQEAIAYRRSVRVYDPDQSIDSEIVKECIRQATLAPTSSNLQLWEFYHVTQKDTKEAMAKGKKFKKNSFIYDFMSSLRQKVNDPLGMRAKKRKEISQR